MWTTLPLLLRTTQVCWKGENIRSLLTNKASHIISLFLSMSAVVNKKRYRRCSPEASWNMGR